MYPYRAQKKAAEPILRAKEAPSLSTDRRLQELLLQAKQDAAAMEQSYHTLQQEERLQEGKDTLQTMITDTKKHQRILRELLFALFSDTAEEVLEEIAEGGLSPKAAEVLLEELLFQEMDDVAF
ncbi:MAG: hypothetical protein Q4C06_08015, partial [Bacillota bacterium]|nr:hypothetical protein [Bacillota bacterium]